LPASRDYAAAGPLRLAEPHLAAHMGWLFPLALIGSLATWWRYRQSPAHERLQLAPWAGWALCYGVVFSAAGGLFHAYYLVVMAPALSALASIGLVALWSLYAAGGAASLVFPATLIGTALWQGYIVEGYLTAYLAIGEKWLVSALLGATGLATAGLLVMRPPLRAPAMLLSGLTISSLLAVPAAWSLGAVLVEGNTGFPVARPPFLNEAAETQRRRWSLSAGLLNGDPKLLTFLQGNHQSERFCWPRSMPAKQRRSSSQQAIRSSHWGALRAGTRSSPSTALRAWSKTTVCASRWSATAAPVCGASSAKTAKSPWLTGSKKMDGSSIPLDGGPRRPMAPMAAALPK
jgi:hypothetical protein